MSAEDAEKGRRISVAAGEQKAQTYEIGCYRSSEQSSHDFSQQNHRKYLSMNRVAADVIAGAISIAITVFITRWIAERAVAEQPKRCPAGSIYRIRLRIRVVSYVAVALFMGITVFALREGSRGTAALFSALALIAIWFGTGNVTTNATGITKRTLLRSQTFKWDEVSVAALHKRDGGAVELSSGSKRMIVDMRFVAPGELLAEIEQHTNIRPVRD